MTTWDEAKRLSNIAKHGVDFAMVVDFDFNVAIIREDASSRGERREVAIGPVGDKLYPYVYTLRGEDDEDHAISLRLANRGTEASMPVKSKPLTAAELQVIERDRAAAREKFARHISDDGEPSGTFDPDNPPLTDAELAGFRPAREVDPSLVAARLRRKADRG